jgi:hypothetical protein
LSSSVGITRDERLTPVGRMTVIGYNIADDCCGC